MKVAIVVGFLFMLAGLGCSFDVQMNASSETDMGPYHVVVKPGGTLTSASAVTRNGESVYEYTSGETKVEIRNDVLVVNDVRYGELTSGEDILIDHGTVFVDGEKREGEPMIPQRTTDAAHMKKSSD